MYWKMIFHPPEFTMCYGSYTAMPAGWVQPAHGEMVECRACGRPGIIPDEGHELRFLPPGTERGPDGGFTYRPPDG
jgi:hypothetical protein